MCRHWRARSICPDRTWPQSLLTKAITWDTLTGPLLQLCHLPLQHVHHHHTGTKACIRMYRTTSCSRSASYSVKERQRPSPEEKSCGTVQTEQETLGGRMPSEDLLAEHFYFILHYWVGDSRIYWCGWAHAGFVEDRAPMLIPRRLSLTCVTPIFTLQSQLHQKQSCWSLCWQDAG